LLGSAIWCLACHGDIIIAGCRNGSIEVLLVGLFFEMFSFAAVESSKVAGLVRSVTMTTYTTFAQIRVRIN